MGKFKKGDKVRPISNNHIHYDFLIVDGIGYDQYGDQYFYVKTDQFHLKKCTTEFDDTGNLMYYYSEHCSIYPDIIEDIVLL